MVYPGFPRFMRSYNLVSMVDSSALSPIEPKISFNCENTRSINALEGCTNTMSLATKHQLGQISFRSRIRHHSQIRLEYSPGSSFQSFKSISICLSSSSSPVSYFMRQCQNKMTIKIKFWHASTETTFFFLVSSFLS